MGRTKKKMTLSHRDKRRKPRARPTPKWLLRPSDLDEMAKRRCLMILSVLSGERPVTDVVEAEQISRMTYYQMETRALRAMLAALMPGAEQAAGTSAAERIRQLEKQVQELEKHKRRAERLLLWTRQVVKPGALTTGVGRKRSRSPSSTSAGRKPSHASRPKPTTPGATESASIPSGGSESKP